MFQSTFRWIKDFAKELARNAVMSRIWTDSIPYVDYGFANYA